MSKISSTYNNQVDLRFRMTICHLTDEVCRKIARSRKRPEHVLVTIEKPEHDVFYKDDELAITSIRREGDMYRIKGIYSREGCKNIEFDELVYPVTGRVVSNDLSKYWFLPREKSFRELLLESEKEKD